MAEKPQENGKESCLKDLSNKENINPSLAWKSLKNWDNIKQKQEARNTHQQEWEGWNLCGYAFLGGGGEGRGETRCIMVYVEIVNTKHGPFLWTYFCGPSLIFGHDF